MARRLAGRYLLGAEIGAGGTSRVHTAIDERLDRRVAVKLLDVGMVASADPAGRDRFLREGRTTAAFTHPNAVTVFDAGEDDGDLYIVMELVDGVSLARHLADRGALPIAEAVRIARLVLAALAAAHTAGIVHRDVKPANVLLGADGLVKLADFGIARRFDELDESVTATGIVMGTPRYLAPEQAFGTAATPATDVYTTGIVLFEMLAGQPPFVADSAIATAIAQQSRPAPDVRSLRSDVPDGLAAVVSTALRTDVADRYPDATAMAIALEEAWTPPGSVSADRAGGSPEAGVPTVAMAAAPVAGVRAGDTQVLPPPPVVGDTTDDRPTGDRPTGSPSSTTVLLVMLPLVLGAVLIALLVSSLLGGSEISDLVADDTGSPVTEPAVTEPPVTEPLVTEPLVTESPVTDPLVTEPPVTDPPPADDPPVEANEANEVIPGFPATDDLEVFLAQLRVDPDLVGEGGEDLVDEFEDVLAERGRDQRDDAAELREHLVEWVAAGELHPAIAAALDELLIPLTTPGPR